MSGRNRQAVKNQINSDVDDYNKIKYAKRNKKKSQITEAEFRKCGIELTPKQDDLFKNIKRNTLSVVQGPAGTAKTFVACYTALALLATRKIDKIILTKPIKESGENLGALPGDIGEKVEPFMQSYLSNFNKIIGGDTTNMLVANNEIVIQPLAYMRGDSYDNCVMLLDEAQNCTMKQLMLWATRLGNDSRAILMGDTSQYDVRKRDSGFASFIEMVGDMDNLLNFEFSNEDIVRNKFLIELTNRYDKYRSENEN
jgi:phosphate starvation-inducible PhoH-like protein